MTKNPDLKLMVELIDDCIYIPPSMFHKKWVGKKINDGSTREVFELKGHEDRWIIKVEHAEREFANVIEHAIWRSIQYADWWSKWFAPCLFLHQNGKFLVQRRAEFKDKLADYPKEVPHWFTDLKIKNYGWIDGRFVAVDYPSVLGMLTGMMTKKMRRARWRKE